MWEQILVYLVPIAVAALAGGMIGIEREYRDKSAGFRTMILIAIGTALFTILSVKLGAGEKESTRIAASIVTGIGFLGAGVIMKDGTIIRGITTAASIWLVAALGMAAGVGQYEMVGVVTTVALIILWLFPPFERWIDRLHEFITIYITVKNTDAAEDNILDIFDECGIKVVDIRRSVLEKGERILEIKANLNSKKHKALSEILVAEKGIIRFHY